MTTNTGMERSGFFDRGRRGQRFMLFRGKQSRRTLYRLYEETASEVRTLVLHAEDDDYRPYFPNVFTVTKLPKARADMHTDSDYTGLKHIPDESYELILCSGILEHMREPTKIIAEMHRILKPGGRAIVSASAVFAFHAGPTNYFHFTPFAFRLLFKEWSEIEMMRGSSQPFETVGILMQRILLQCDMFPLARPVIEILARCIRVFDRFIYRQYYTRNPKRPDTQIDSMAPQNVHAIVRK